MMCYLKMLLIMCSVFLGSKCFSETLDVFVEERHKIRIDGDLSDWNDKDYSHIMLSFYNDSTSFKQNFHSDLSSSFRLLADREHLFLGITVHDDVMVYGQSLFGSGWNDDSIEICFDGDCINSEKHYYDSNDGQIIAVLKDSGKMQLEGMVPYLLQLQVPGFWEAMNVKSCYKIDDYGYTAEIKIPLNLMGISQINDIYHIGLSLKIFDDDNENGDQDIDHVLSWISNPNAPTFLTTRDYNRIRLINKTPSSPVFLEKHRIQEIFHLLDSNNYENVIQSSSDLWSQFFQDAVNLQRIHFHKAYETSVKNFYSNYKLYNENPSCQYIKNYPLQYVKELLTVDDISHYYSEIPYEIIFKLLLEVLRNDPENVEAITTILHVLPKLHHVYPDIGEKIADELIKQPNILRECQYLCAVYYYLERCQYQMASQICSDLIRMSDNDQIKLKAMLIHDSLQLEPKYLEERKR